jgi:hypothetical protein
MGVQDTAIVIETSEKRNADATGLQGLNVLVNGGEASQPKTFNVRVLAWRRFSGMAD